MMMNRTFLTLLRRAVCTAAICFLCGCSLPRIIILNDPLSVEEHNNLGRIYQSQGKPDLAEQQYREALKKDSKSAASLLLLGDLSFQQKKYPDAEAAYRKAIKLQPENGDIYNNLCWVYLEQNVRIDEAEDLARKAITLTPEHHAYYIDTLGMVLLKQGKTAEAIAEFNQSIELMPKDNADYLMEAYRHLAQAYRSAGDAVKAEEAEQKAEKYRHREEPAVQIRNYSQPAK